MLKLNYNNFNTAFTGIKSPYNKNGYFIYPISKDPDINDIKMVKKVINNSNYIGSGLNGDVYLMNEFVVKKQKNNAIVQNAIIKEAKKLDIIYEAKNDNPNLNIGGSQKGIFAFVDSKGNSYLVSTKVQGKKATSKENTLNRKNLESLINIITNLDIGSEKYGRLMSYDLNGDNIKFTDTEAGIFDFEYLGQILLDTGIKEKIINKKTTTNSHISDTSGLDSNMRSFEYNGLYDYLKQCTQEDARKIFKIWLNLKSKYHLKMSQYYKNKIQSSSYPWIVKNISKREEIHSKVLSKTNLSEDIVKAEALKIQIAEFLFRASHDRKTGFINPKQILDYYTNAHEFFLNKLLETSCSKNKLLFNYYSSCLNLINRWSKIKNLLKTEYPIQRLTKENLFTLEKQVIKRI